VVDEVAENDSDKPRGQTCQSREVEVLHGVGTEPERTNEMGESFVQVWYPSIVTNSKFLTRVATKL
jgi:hypothetical protein